MRQSSLLSLPLAAVAAVACTPAATDGDVDAPLSLFAEVTIDTILTAEDGLLGPRDLDFNPEVAGEMWVINRTDDGAITVRDVGTTAQTSQYRKDPFALHFMEETSSISFATGKKFGTCGESRNTYDNQARGNDFMGPALWSAEDDVFAISNPDAVEELTEQFGQETDLGSHLDMMHETPLCMGIAWVPTGIGEDNVYFVFEGLTSTIARYDFKSDHGPGFDYHGDGTVERFTDVDVKRLPDVPSHLAWDADNELLYVADSGNKRVMVLDPSRAIALTQFAGFETMVQELEGGTWTPFVDVDAGIEAPSGLALKDGILYVGDNATSKVHAYDLEGNLLDTLDLSGEIEAGSLMGIRITPAGDALYAVDFRGNRVIRVQGLAP